MVFRASMSAGRGRKALNAPTIAAPSGVGVGQQMTIASGGGAVDHYVLLRAGVEVGTIANPYTFIAPDCWGITGGSTGIALTVKAVDASGNRSPASNALAYDPMLDPGLVFVEWWTVRAGVSLTGSLIDSIAGRKNGWLLTATGTQRPSYSATSIVAEDASTYPGMAFAGAQGMKCADAALGAAIHALKTCHVVVGGQGGSGLIGSVVEYGANSFGADGRWGIALNDVNHDSWEIIGHQTGNGIWASATNTLSWIDPGVVTVSGIGGASACSTSISLDGVALDGAASQSAFVPGSFFGTNVLHIGSSNETSSFLTAKISDIAIFDPATTAAGLAGFRAFVGPQIGAPQA